MTITVRDNIADNGGPAFAVDDTITVTIKVTNDETDDAAVVNKEPIFTEGPSTTREVAEEHSGGYEHRFTGPGGSDGC